MKSFLKPLFSAGLSFCFLVGIVAPAPLWAAEVPQSGIDYTLSRLYVSYTDAITGFVNDPGNFECFDTAINNLNTFGKSLSTLGVSSSSDLIDIIGGNAEGCFQKSGTYYLQFQLVDGAGNCGLYPSGIADCFYNVSANPPGTGIGGWAAGQDDPNWYKFVVKPSTPDATQTGAPVVTLPAGTPPLPADNASVYDVEITLRDAFGNVVTQINDADHVSLDLATLIGDIEVDGLFDPMATTTDIQHNQTLSEIFGDTGTGPFSNTSSADTFARGLQIGDGSSWVTLKTLFDTAADIPLTDANVNEGVINFQIKSSVPSIKLITSTNPADGAGVYNQNLTFNPKTLPINNDGTINTSGSVADIGGSVNQVTGPFAFRPVNAIKPAITSPSVTWGEPVEDVTVDVSEAITAGLRYLFWTPISDYVLKKETEEPDPVNGGTKAVLSYPDLWTPNSNPLSNVFNGSVPRLVFEAATGSVGGAPSDIGIGTMIEYAIAGIGNVRHHSRGTDTGSCGADFVSRNISGEDVDCYAFGGSIAARFIGADIEGAVIAERSEVLIYSIDDSATGGQVIGQQTGFSGGLSNDRIQESLRTNINQAVRNPASTAVYAAQGGNAGVLMSDVVSGLAVNSTDVVIIEPGDNLIIDTATVPSGKHTIIVTDGNVYVESNMQYTNPNDSLGIIAYNTSFTRNDGEAPETGHIIVRDSVQKMVGTYYADGSLLSLTPGQITDLKNGSDTVNDLGYIIAGKEANQLLLEGIILSNNTLGGALIDSTDYSTPWHNNGTDNAEIARLYDLHFVRRYVAGGGTCTPGTILGCDGNTNAFVIRLDNKATYPETAPPVFSDLPEIAQ